MPMYRLLNDVWEFFFSSHGYMQIKCVSLTCAVQKIFAERNKISISHGYIELDASSLITFALKIFRYERKFHSLQIYIRIKIGKLYKFVLWILIFPQNTLVY